MPIVLNGSGIIINNKPIETIKYAGTYPDPDGVGEPTTDTKIATFTHSGGGENQTSYTINFPTTAICDILIVGGGGGGDREIGGGGGGGAVLYATNITIPANNYTILVGKGGTQGLNGSQSEAFGAICLGGGSTVNTGLGNPENGRSGGSGSGGSSGGGGSGGGGVGASSIGTFLQSNKGNLGIINLYNGNAGGGCDQQNASGYVLCGGGGGAGTVGNYGNNAQRTTRAAWIAAGSPGKGGDGVLVNITGDNYYWGAGGGGAGHITHSGDGGLGGGGAGGVASGTYGFGGGMALNPGRNASGINGTDGGAHTGSGGGGGGWQNTTGGTGGSGIVIIRYKLQPAIINNDYKYFSLTTYNVPDLIYNFAPYGTLEPWKAYADKIPGVEYLLNYHVFGGVYYDPGLAGFISLPLPNTHNNVSVTFSNPYSSGTVSLYINNILLETVSAGQTKTYTQNNYTPGQILKVVEDSVIGQGLYIIFTKTNTSYTVNFPEAKTCDILIVGGGGSGGGSGGGGGGAGGLIYITDVNISQGTYNINVGSGGVATAGDIRRKGSDSTFSTYTAFGGGSGQDMSGTTGFMAGGSGGGGQRNSIDGFGSGGVAGGLGTSGQGNNGGQGKNFSGSNSGGGGGGGAGGVGISAFTAGRGANGGNGLIIPITGSTTTYYAGGGGGGSASDYNTAGIGGLGGGGNGAIWANAGISATAHTGGGGGGGSAYPGDGRFGGNGGSGIVIIRFPRTKIPFDAQWTYNPLNTSVYHMGNVGIYTATPTNALHVIGNTQSTTYSANSKTFKIEHPLNLNKWLYHGCIEGPRFDNIYRGKKRIVDGRAEVNIDTECNTTGGMTLGTFPILNTNTQFFIRNNQTYDRIKGKLEGNILTIECENISDEIEIDWMVVGERHDEHVINTPLTDSDGNLICEHDIM
jgi:hypothetical protein